MGVFILFYLSIYICHFLQMWRCTNYFIQFKSKIIFCFCFWNWGKFCLWQTKQGWLHWGKLRQQWQSKGQNNDGSNEVKLKVLGNVKQTKRETKQWWQQWGKLGQLNNDKAIVYQGFRLPNNDKSSKNDSNKTSWDHSAVTNKTKEKQSNDGSNEANWDNSLVKNKANRQIMMVAVKQIGVTWPWQTYTLWIREWSQSGWRLHIENHIWNNQLDFFMDFQKTFQKAMKMPGSFSDITSIIIRIFLVTMERLCNYTVQDESGKNSFI